MARWTDSETTPPAAPAASLEGVKGSLGAQGGARPPVRPLFQAAEVRRLLARPQPRGAHRFVLVQRQRLLGRYAQVLERLLAAAERRTSFRTVWCPICDWAGIRFRPYVGPGWVRRNNTCPACGSQERHRLFWLLGRELLSGGADGTVLHVAPEDCLRPLVDALPATVLTTDLDMGGVDVRSDLEQLPIGDATLSTILCSDVLEHLDDDVAALREVRRVLGEGGRVLAHVPILCSETVEYGCVVAADNDHRRAYGPDVVDRFTEAGLCVGFRLAKDLAPAERRRFGLFDEDVLLVATKT